MLSEQREFETPQASRWIFPLILGVVLVGLAIAVVVSRQLGGHRRDGMGAEHPAVGLALKHLALEPLTGADRPLMLDDLAGKVVLINIWGTWCGPCLIELPHLKELAEHYRAVPGFRFVSVSCSPPGAIDPELAENTAALLKELQADFPTYGDPREETRGEIARVAGERNLPYPTSVILGRDGKVRALWFGYREGLTTEMREVIDAALREKAA
jgi:thiol-disulfide isomerase/thioredoxin